MADFLKTSFLIIFSVALHGVIAWIFIKLGERAERRYEVALRANRIWSTRFWNPLTYLCYGVGGLVLLDLASMFYGAHYE